MPRERFLTKRLAERGDALERLRVAAQQFVDLFVWEPDEETGEIVPHLDRQFPDFSVALTELRNSLAKTR